MHPGGLSWLEVEYSRWETQASIPLDQFSRLLNTSVASIIVITPTLKTCYLGGLNSDEKPSDSDFRATDMTQALQGLFARSRAAQLRAKWQETISASPATLARVNSRKANTALQPGRSTDKFARGHPHSTMRAFKK